MDRDDVSELGEAFAEIEKFDFQVDEVRVNHSQRMSQMASENRTEPVTADIWGADIRRTNRVPKGYAVVIGETYKTRDQNDRPYKFRAKSIARFKGASPSRKMARQGLGFAHSTNGIDEFPVSLRRMGWIIGFALDERSARRLRDLSDLFHNDIVDEIRWLERSRLDNGKLEHSNPLYAVTRRWRPTDPAWLIQKRKVSRS